MATIGRSPIAPTEAAAETGDRLRPLPKGERADRQVGEGILAVEGYIWDFAELSIPQSRQAVPAPFRQGGLTGGAEVRGGGIRVSGGGIPNS